MPLTPAETWATALLHGWCVTFKFNFIYKTSRRTTRLMCFTSGAVYVKFPAPNTQTSIWNTTLKVFAEVIFKPNISERFLSQSSVVQFCLDGSCLCLASVKLLLCSASTLSLCFEELHSVFFSFHCFISGKLSDGPAGSHPAIIPTKSPAPGSHLLPSTVYRRETQNTDIRDAGEDFKIKTSSFFCFSSLKCGRKKCYWKPLFKPQ